MKIAPLLAAWVVTACTPPATAPADPVLEEEAALVELAVPDHTPAVVSVPRGARSRRPVIVATHGAGDRAEWHCEMWRGIVGDSAFVLCPQGRRMDERVPHAESAYYYPDHFALEREVVAALAALRARYPDHVDDGGALYTGFSQGAIMGALVIVMHPDLFPRAVLVEGGHGSYKEWSAPAAKKYAGGGGRRLLFACGSPWCVQSAKRSTRYLENAGVATRVVHAEGAGHSYGAAMESQIRENFGWVVGDDPRF
jgi:predicted esterase